MILNYLLLSSTYHHGILNLISRAGGGGSGGFSGGGGYSGGGSGSSNVRGVIILFSMPLILMLVLASSIKGKVSTSLGNIILWSLTVISAAPMLILLSTGGLPYVISALIGAGIGSYILSYVPNAKLINQAKTDVQTASMVDSSWNEQELKDHTTKIFLAYQDCWSKGDITKLKDSFAPRYYQHASLMIQALAELKRTNLVADPQIQDLQITNIKDVDGQDGDSFTMQITAKANDQLIDNASNQIIYTESSSFTEFWTFVRANNQWQLDLIDQSTANPSLYNNPLDQFAKDSGMYFSLDWGWLLLPQRGQLFELASFLSSDINNHVIGMQGRTGNQILTQIYNYVPRSDDIAQYGTYLIAQATLPKSYQNIIVRRKRRFSFKSPKGLTRLEMESVDFNAKFEVWASSIELATSFELLHPAFIQKLEELPFEVNIEVVDTTLYLYSPNSKLAGDPQNAYTILLQILNEAFKQMKM